jgi:2-polyprenyl-3-methyl-5-hydroxy-6-metoxy-1,4-benzoquinol methylase
MEARKHWETIYRTKASDAVSWYRPHLEKSLELIARTAVGLSASIIDVGGGEKTLVDDLLAHGYMDVSVLDISQVAVDVAKQRLGNNAARVRWLVADITQIRLPEHRYDVWHDRAVFHFLTEPEQRAAYVRQVAHAMQPGGHVIVATFGPQGPEKCSGLDAVRYGKHVLHGQFGVRFRLVESTTELHRTPAGTTQQFLYCYCKVERGQLEGCGRAGPTWRTSSSMAPCARPGKPNRRSARTRCWTRMPLRRRICTF